MSLPPRTSANRHPRAGHLVRSLTTILVLTVTVVSPSPGEEPSVSGEDPSFMLVAEFLDIYCVGCHGGGSPEAAIALDRYEEGSRAEEDYEIWQKVLHMLTEREMPPEGELQPKEPELDDVLRIIEATIASVDCGGDPRPGRVTIRRLNRAEYNNTIRDLVGIGFQPAADFPADDVGNGFDNIGDVLSLSPVLLEKYLAAAERIVTEAWQDEEARERILVRSLEGNRREVAAALRENLRAFAARAFRRPVSDEEMRRLRELIRLARDSGTSDEEALQTALQAVLVSPHFLYRVERDPEPGDEDGIRELDDYELATRLSYFLWSSMPDDELFELAADGALSHPETLQSQVQRMLQDDKSEALVENFAGQWLQLRDLEGLSPDPAKFPQFDDELREAMRKETEIFFANMIREDRSILDLLSADFTFVNERLAEFYGLVGVEGDDFERVPVANGRGGILTQASILLITSNPTRTSPVKRGKWILDNILDDPPPPPPPGVEELGEDAETIGTLREQMEQHRADPTCASCHQRMDPLGFGLENFDAIGAWRDRVGHEAIDASGTLPGGDQFEGPGELVQLLARQKREDFCRCLTKKLLTYALGRGLESYDRCTVDIILEQLAEEDYRFSSLVTAIVLSDPFRLRGSIQEN